MITLKRINGKYIVSTYFDSLHDALSFIKEVIPLSGVCYTEATEPVTNESDTSDN